MTGRQDRARAGYHPARRCAAEADARLSRRVPGRNPSRPARAEGQAMSKVVVALALVLASAATAHAECAWGLWREESDRAACGAVINAMVKTWEGAERGQPPS